MNPVFHAAAEAAEYGWLMGVMTAAFLATFLGWTWWAWRPKNRPMMEAAANLPFDDDGVSQ